MYVTFHLLLSHQCYACSLFFLCSLWFAAPPPKVNGFHPQLTAVSNPVRPNDISPPSWPSYVPPPPSHSRRADERRNRRRGRSPSASSSPLVSLSSPHGTSTTRIPTAPMTSDIDARTTIVVRRLQDDAKESDRSRSKMLRKRVRREERSERRHLKRRLRQHHSHTCGGRRTSETSETSFSSTTSSLTTATSTGTYNTDSDITSSATATSYAGSSDASACCSGSSATHPRVTSSSSTIQAKCSPTPGCAPQPIPMHANAAADRVIEEETHFSELYTDVFMASNKPQFLATLGGRLVACEFVQVKVLSENLTYFVCFAFGCIGCCYLRS